ncbi:MAG TPA: TatD family hydrolase [Cytophagales bacterium]|nr:TatD family hydrolase [Cytophagales bacterium]
MPDYEFIDTHAHIYYDDLYTHINDLLADCNENGISKIYMPNVDKESIDRMLELEERFPAKCIAMMGLHPCSVKEDFEQQLKLVEDWVSKRQFSAIGEIGIDYYWTREFDKQQEEAFHFQLDLAKKNDLPVAIHSRNSLDTVISILKNRKESRYKGVLHCFTGTLPQAKELIEMGLYLGIGGVVTFKNAGVDKVVAELDMENLVLETDSPYLSPVPYRGKPNSPVYLPIIAQKIAELKGVTIKEVAATTTENAMKLFA